MREINTSPKAALRAGSYGITLSSPAHDAAAKPDTAGTTPAPQEVASTKAPSVSGRVMGQTKQKQQEGVSHTDQVLSILMLLAFGAWSQTRQPAQLSHQWAMIIYARD